MKRRHPFSKAEEIFRGEIPSRLEDREEMIQKVLAELEARGCRPDGFVDRNILDEALANAIIHGNAEDPKKRVTVKAFCREDSWGVEVEDEGKGFDWEEVLARIQGGVESSGATGRGLFLIVRSAAQVEFLDGGRRIVIVRKRG